MSSRAARKLLKEKLGKEEFIEEEEEEEEEIIVPKVKNAFDLLMEEEDVDSSVQEEEEEEMEENEGEEESSNAEKQKNRINSSSNAKNRNKKNKKKSRKAKREEEDEKILKKFAEMKANEANLDGKSQVVDEESLLLESQPEFLDPDNELVKLFGKQTIKEAMKEKKGSRRVNKRTNLIKPKESWPQVPEGLSMEFLGSEGGHSYFKVNWDETYKKVQEQFYLCVQSFDPNSFQALLQVYPYHVDSLLQLSTFCNQTGQFEMAMDLMERALYSFESCWHPMFNPLRGNCRLPYDIEENKPFYLAIFKFITMLGREGTSRSALEYCKLLLSLDLGDPLFILFIMDYYAVRSGQYQYVLEMYASSSMDEKRLSTLPNWNYSLALARFKMEQQALNPKKDDKKGSKDTAPKKSTEALMAQSSDDLLQHALMMFPMVLSPLAKKGGFQLTRVDPVSRATDDMTQHAFFVDFPVNPKNLQQIVTLFVERNFTLWKDPEVVKWLKKNVETVITRIQKRDVMVTNFSTILQEEYINTERDLFNHLLLSEYTDNIAANALPPDVAQALRGGGQVEIYQGFHEAQAIRAANAPRIHATTNNPALLFLQTLMPWNQTPNAPPL